MLPNISIRARKSLSLGYAKDDKENINNNVLPIQNKLAKIKDQLVKYNITQKTIKSQKVQNKQDIGKKLKNQYNKILKQNYSSQIMQSLLIGSHPLGQNILQNHSITINLRIKMVDWMIEVLSSYKNSQQTFFRSTQYMDMFFKKCNKKLQVADLHLIGVSCMFIASKFQQIYPIRLSVMYDKICRKKFSKNQIIQMEQQILSALQFNLQQTTIYDIVQNIICNLEINLTKKQQKYLNEVSLYISKLAIHINQLAWKQNQKIAAAIVFVSLKTIEQVKDFQPQIYLNTISEMTKVDLNQIIMLSHDVLYNAKNFSKLYPNLKNLTKFNLAQYSQ